MKKLSNRFLACWLCVLLNLVGVFGYAQSTVLCLKEEGRHALEFSTDGYRCHSSTAMSEPAFHPSDKGEIPPTEEHCGSCLDTPVSILSFVTNFSFTRRSTPGFDFAMPVERQNGLLLMKALTRPSRN